MTAELLKQHNVICDECGVRPIFGTRYKASHIYDYDICGICIQDHDLDDRKKFVAFHEPVPYEVSRTICPVTDTSFRANSLHAAAVMIQQNLIDKNHAHINFGGNELDPEGASEKLKMALICNTQLEVIHIHMCGWRVGHLERNFTNKCISNIAEGIASNHSIRRMFWHIGKTFRNETTATSLSDMIRNNTTLDTLFLGRMCHQPDSSNFQMEQSDQFATIIFNGLKENSTLKVLRLSSYNVLSETTKESLLEIIKTKNKTIQKVYSEFHHDDPDGDDDTHRLNLLLACNRKKWIQQLTDIDATKRKQIEILNDALLECPETSSLEPVATAYHLLRCRPDLCETK